MGGSMSECFFVAYGGHWGKRGWTYYEVKFTTISAALQFYRGAKQPAYIGRKSGKFKSELTERGIEAEIEKEKGANGLSN